MIFFLYTFLLRACAPLLRWHLARRARIGKEDPARITERYGVPSAPRFDTAPVWIHAASVGEAQSALTVIELLRATRPDMPVILTTGTVTSANVMARRLPANTVHQYAPLDHPDWIKNFLNYWAPCAAIRIESELWPTTLRVLKSRGIKTILLNGHMSPRSFARWHILPATIQQLLRTFDLIVAEGEKSAAYFRAFGARNLHTIPNLKFIADPLPFDEHALETLRASIQNRPVWLYASTHDDEEVLAASLHQKLSATIPNLLTIIAPRHPDRRDKIYDALVPDNLNMIFRSSGLLPQPETALFIADSMGEMGLFYRLSPLAVIGRSFSADGGGGHNPIEAALLGCFPLSGPNVQNLQPVFDAMADADAVQISPTPEDLFIHLRALLQNPEQCAARADAARQMVIRSQQEIRTRLNKYLHEFMGGVV